MICDCRRGSSRRRRAPERGGLRARVAVLAAAAASAWLGAGAALRAADVTSTWGGSTGNWGAAANWNNSPAVNQFPNNGNGGFTYDAIVNVGTVTLDQDIVIQAFTLNGATLTGDHDLTLGGRFTWSGGSLSGAGALNANGGVSITNTTGTPTLRRTLNLTPGTTSTLGGPVQFLGGVLNNAGTLNNTTDANLFFGGGTGNAINNSGTFAKTGGAGTTSIGASITFTNTGQVRVDTGTLLIGTGGAHTGSFAVASGAVLGLGGGTFSGASSISGAGGVDFTAGTATFSGSYNVTGGTTFSGGTTTFTPAAAVSSLGPNLTFTGGSAVFNNQQPVSVTNLRVTSGGPTFNTGSPVAASTLTFQQGQIDGSDTINIAGLFAWSGGALAGPGVTNANGGATITNTFGTPTLRHTLNLPSGTTSNLNGPIQFINGVLNNAGTLNNSGDSNLFIGGGTGNVINNPGTFAKTGGTQTTSIGGGIAFNNTGQVRVDTGTIQFSGGGTHTGSFTVAPGATLDFRGGTHDLQQTSSVTGGGTVLFGGATVAVAGTYAVAGATTIANSSVAFTNPQALSFSSLTMNGGAATFDTGNAVTASTLNFSQGQLGGNDDVNVPGLFTWSGGTLAAGGATNANGGAAISNAFGTPTLRRTLRLASGTTSTLTGALQFGGGVIENAGTLNNTGDVSLFLGSGTGNAIINSGTFAKTGGAGTSSVGSGITFTNTGQVRVDTGTLNITVGGAHTGSFAVASGAVLGLGGGTFSGASTVSGAGSVNFTDGTATFSGAYNVTGGTTFVGGTTTFTPAATVSSLGPDLKFTLGSAVFNNAQPIAVSNLEVIGGGPTFNTGSPVTTSTLTVRGGDTGGADALDVAGLFTWSGGTLSGTGITNANGGVAISNTAATPVLRRTLRLSAGTTSTLNGPVQFLSGVLINAGTLNNTADSSLFIGGGSGNAFTNSGTFAKTGGTGTTSVGFGIDFDNSGIVNVDTGTLVLAGGGTHTGAFTVAAGATLNFQGGTHTLLPPSSVTGAGTIQFGGATATVAGTYNVASTLVSAGSVAFNAPATTGTLTITGGALSGSGSITVTNLSNTGGTLTTGAATVKATSVSLDPGTTNTVNAGGTLVTDALTVSGGTNTVAAFGTIVVGGGPALRAAAASGPLAEEVPEILTFTGTASPTITLTSHPSNPGKILLGADVVANIPSGTARVSSVGPVPIAGTIDLNAGARTFTVSDGTAAVDMEVSARITNGSLRKSGPGTLRLTAASDYAGGTTLSGGTLELAHPAAAGTGPLAFSGGRLNLLNSAADTTYTFPLTAAPANSISLDVARVGGGAAIVRVPSITLGAALDVTGLAASTLVVSGPLTLQADATINNAAGMTLNGPVTGGFGFTKTLGGVLTLGGAAANTYSGTTTVNEGELALGKTGGAAAVPGPLRINGPGSVRLTAPNQIADAAAVTVNAASGAATFDLNGQSETIGSLDNGGAVFTRAGNLRVGPITGAGAITVAAGGSFTANYVRQDSLTVAGTAAVRTRAAGGATSAVKALLIAGADDTWTGKLDLADTALIVDYPSGGPSAAAKVANQLKSGRAGGAWNGNGITSSSAASTANTSLGFAEASSALGASGGTFQGQPSDGTAVLVRWTLLGDANLDGFVNGTDFALLAGNFGKTSQSWYSGDFNYDSAVNGTDFALLAGNFGRTVPAAAVGLGLSAGDWEAVESFGASIGVAVPEPGPAALLVLAGLGLLRRRRGRGPLVAA